MRVPRRPGAVGARPPRGRRAGSSVALLGVLAAGCGGGGPLAGERIVVSGTQTTEQMVLGQVTLVRLRAAGADAVDQTNASGSSVVRAALLDGTVDLTWSYTGTGWRNDLRRTPPIRDPDRQLAAVRRADRRANDVAWIAPAAYDAGWAVVAGRRGRAAGWDTVTTVVRAARQAPVRLCADRAFARDPEGLRALRSAYDTDALALVLVPTPAAQVHPSVARGERCDVGVVPASGPQVRRRRLRLLQDDRDALISYRPVVTVRASTLRAAPALDDVLRPLGRALTGRQIRRLVAEVEAGAAIDGVARRWLRRTGLDRVPSAGTGATADRDRGRDRSPPVAAVR